MEFTAEQEAKLLQIIAAFDGGKRLNELPHADITNPFDLIVEVLDMDGESKQARLAALLPYLEDQCAYGIEWDTTVSSPLCNRVGNMALHRSLPVQSLMKGCILDDNGKVVEYLTPTNWLAHVRDGSVGQVMVEIPAHYRKFETDGTKRRAWLSLYPLPGYHAVKRKYVAAYEASVQRSTSKLCSVVNVDVDYRGGGNQAAWDGTHCSVLGRPVTALSLPIFRNYARKRNPSTTEWNCFDYNTFKDVSWLFYIEYANLNCQARFNASKDANGYAQGGLGSGVTSILNWGEFNGYYPFIPCGHTDELGNASGEVVYTTLKEDGTTHGTVMVPRYRGIENPFGHIWKWLDGINIVIQSEADGGVSKVYVCDDPAKYSDSGITGYSLRGEEARTDAYVKEMIIGEFGEIIPSVVGGGSSTFWCDHHYTGIPESGTILNGVRFGGCASFGAHSGLSCMNSASIPSTVNTADGSRLCFIPALV